MGTEITRYAIGDFGKLHKFTGKTVPAGTEALVEEDGTSLTAKGKTYTARFSDILPNVEIIRVQFDQYSSNHIGFAMEAHDRTLTKIPEMLESTKIISEKLRHDWMAQDKAYQDTEKAKKVVPAAAKVAAPAKEAIAAT
ncbi:hypothetical protein [Candidatus Nitrospira neomarina]|uniref:Uncharacterized protein n=1 Tax=Candidatus Nitrospira neomarina TaxID=3020899 RepID=A0AA96GNF5_9BACT|nr:hypothetical protein [Candidatus Nitrospira neomarina]WNM60701.1 hypothetical protein PQG83_13130 [Candidatus Nitrospira neomarina]